MKKKIVIIGSTGSIGKNTLEIIKTNKKDFEIKLLSTFRNIDKVFNQAKQFKVKNIIINDYKKYLQAKKKYKYTKIKIFNKFEQINKIFEKKDIYYSMISISGIDGLKPALELAKYSKNLAIVNKESLICGWHWIKNAIKKNKTNFIPIDSEHFSIFSLLEKNNTDEIDRVYITASGGPFINLPKKSFDKIKPKDALKHPNWKMGRKITIDSATLMNKVFEVIEARNIFNISYDKISILTHPKSYIHAIIKFKNGLSKILIHEPDMKIPIYNSLYLFDKKNYKSKSLDLKKLNNLNLKKVNLLKFPLVKLLDKLPKQTSLFETVLITVNDYLVFKFLDNKISFKRLINLIDKVSNLDEFQKYKKIKPKNVSDIYNLRAYVSSKMDSLGI